jgi:hypothetical protein
VLPVEEIEVIDTGCVVEPVGAARLPSFPFPLMIFALVVVNSKTLRLLAARWPRVGRFLVPVPPSALGTNFAAD